VTRDSLKIVLAGVAMFQVDFMGGDANAACYRFYKKQGIPSFGNSSLQVIIKRLMWGLQEMAAPAARPKVFYATNNPSDLKKKNQRWPARPTDLEPACCCHHIFSWHHQMTPTGTRTSSSGG
jgi:hypothetical protein